MSHSQPARMSLLLVSIWCLVACSTEPTPSSSGSKASSETSAAPTGATGPFPTLAEVPTGAILQVVADELRLRSEARTDAGLVGGLSRGAAVRVAAGPVEADGFTWYELDDTTGQRGWAAAGDASDAWLASTTGDDGDIDVLLSFSYGCDVTGPISYPAVTITDQGRVVLGDGRPDGMVVGQLSDSGLAHVRENIIGSPYLQASASFEPVKRADVGDPPGHGACSYAFTVPTGTEPILVTSVSWFGDEEEAAFYEPAPERKALSSMAQNLIAIDDVLTGDAWDSPPTMPYLAGDLALWIGPADPVDLTSVPLIDPLALGLGDLATYGDPAGAGRCAIITLERAFEFVRILNAAPAAEDDVPLDEVTYSAAFRTDARVFGFRMVPLSPDGQPPCDALDF